MKDLVTMMNVNYKLVGLRYDNSYGNECCSEFDKCEWG